MGLNTLRKVIKRYAPGSENPTNAYINFVSKKTSIHPERALNFSKEQVKRIIIAMAEFENGRIAVNADDFEEGWELI